MNSSVSRHSRSTTVKYSHATVAGSKTIVTRWQDSGRLAILLGWLVSMFGIVLYCLTTLNGGTGNEISTIFEGGWKGKAALLLLVTGVLLWLYGAAKSLREIEQQEAQGNDWGATF